MSNQRRAVMNKKILVADDEEKIVKLVSDFLENAGLSIVSAIIKGHNHRCGVYNTENGVCFWFEADRVKETDGQ